MITASVYPRCLHTPTGIPSVTAEEAHALLPPSWNACYAWLKSFRRRLEQTHRLHRSGMCAICWRTRLAAMQRRQL